jgi:FKBP-type peptidyl-prolyl cis-trans isomerase FklB
MKRISFLVVIAIVMAVFVSISSCENAVSEKANLLNDTDSLSYAIGVSRTDRLANYLIQQGIDSIYLADFARGFKAGATVKEGDYKEIAFTMGKQIGQQMSTDMMKRFNTQLYGENSTESLNKADFIAGFLAGIQNKDLKMSMEEANAYIDQKWSAIETKQMEEQFGINREVGIAFLTENSTKEGVVTLPSGLQYKIITKGKGAIPTLDNQVKVHYKGTLIDGTTFDSSYDKGPVEFAVKGVIAGWTEILTLMPVGSKWIVYIPQELAYGAQQQGQLIKPFSALIFEIELLEIVK